MVKILLGLSLSCAACYGEVCIESRAGICLSFDHALGLTQQDIDTAGEVVDLTALTLLASLDDISRKANFSESADLLFSMRVRWVSEPMRCEYRSGRCVGLYDWDRNAAAVLWGRCGSPQVVAHEMIHGILFAGTGNGDRDHERPGLFYGKESLAYLVGRRASIDAGCD